MEERTFVRRVGAEVTIVGGIALALGGLSYAMWTAFAAGLDPGLTPEDLGVTHPVTEFRFVIGLLYGLVLALNATLMAVPGLAIFVVMPFMYWLLPHPVQNWAKARGRAAWVGRGLAKSAPFARRWIPLLILVGLGLSSLVAEGAAAEVFVLFAVAPLVVLVLLNRRSTAAAVAFALIFAFLGLADTARSFGEAEAKKTTRGGPPSFVARTLGIQISYVRAAEAQKGMVDSSGRVYAVLGVQGETYVLLDMCTHVAYRVPTSQYNLSYGHLDGTERSSPACGPGTR